MLNVPPNKKPRFENFNLTKYEAIVKYKTSQYTFCLPVHLAMHLVSIYFTLMVFKKGAECQFVFLFLLIFSLKERPKTSAFIMLFFSVSCIYSQKLQGVSDYKFRDGRTPYNKQFLSRKPVRVHLFLFIQL